MQSQTLHRFLLEAALYKHVGLNLNDLENRPINEARDYMTIISLIEHEQGRLRAAAQARAGRNGGMG